MIKKTTSDGISLNNFHIPPFIAIYPVNPIPIIVDNSSNFIQGISILL